MSALKYSSINLNAISTSSGIGTNLILSKSFIRIVKNYHSSNQLTLLILLLKIDLNEV